jgi:GNAT superfamily N-acetyltransferase
MSYCIHLATSDDWRQVVDLFEQANKEDEHYPPRTSIQASGSIQNWLESSQSEARYVVKQLKSNAVVGYLEIEALQQVINDQQQGDSQAIRIYNLWSKAFTKNQLLARSGISLNELVIIRRLVVLPSHRRYGIGEMLLEYVIQVIKDSSRTPVWIADDNLQPAVQLFRKIGSAQFASSSDNNSIYII